MKIITQGVSDTEFKESLNLIRRFQNQVTGDALRVILADKSLVEGLVTTMYGNFFIVETFPGVCKAIMHSEVVGLEYPPGG